MAEGYAGPPTALVCKMITTFQTYFGMDTTLVEDELKRVALETMVKTYGQTPKKLFSTPHPPRSAPSGLLSILY